MEKIVLLGGVYKTRCPLSFRDVFLVRYVLLDGANCIDTIVENVLPGAYIEFLWVDELAIFRTFYTEILSKMVTICPKTLG